MLCNGPNRHGARAEVGGGLCGGDRAFGKGRPAPRREARIGGGVGGHEEAVREFDEDFLGVAIGGREAAEGLRGGSVAEAGEGRHGVVGRWWRADTTPGGRGAIRGVTRMAGACSAAVAGAPPERESGVMP